MDGTSAALHRAQARAEGLFAEVLARGLLRPGVLESELSREIHALAREAFGVRRHWHRRIVRSGPNTLLTYDQEGPDRRLAEDEILFLDFGPVFGDWEADYGRSYVIGDDPYKKRLVADLMRALNLGQALCAERPSLSAGELYDFLAELAGSFGWSFGAPSAGHLVGRFPHESSAAADQPYSIRHGNPTRFTDRDRAGRARHWIIEVHFVDRKRQIGGFAEELLTPPPR